MTDAQIHAVTGAYGYSEKYIAQRLLDEGNTVITLTNSLSRRNPFGDHIKAFPFHFDQPDLLTEQLRDVSVLYNTYWVRFNHRLFKHADAVRNCPVSPELPLALKDWAVIIHTATGEHLRELEAFFQDVLTSPLDNPTPCPDEES